MIMGYWRDFSFPGAGWQGFYVVQTPSTRNLTNLNKDISMKQQIALASFAGAGVEFLETAAIAYALARSGYPREAIIGTITGIVLVIVPALFAWPLFRLVPVNLFELGVGGMLLGLGLSWVVKSVRRKRNHQRAGWVQAPLRRYQGHLEPAPSRFSFFNAVVKTKSAAVEGFEICMIVSALALASGAWISALAGAFLALIATLGLVVLLHGRLRSVPEVALKFWSGLLLLGIGAFWIYEGLRNWAHHA
jgi:uncharacterized membrane protein